MTTEIKTRDQVATLLFSRESTLRGELDRYSAMQEQLQGTEIPMTPGVEILKLLSVKCSGDLVTFTGMCGDLDTQLIASYMRSLSIRNESIFLLILNGRDDLLGPEDTKALCAKADYYTSMQIDDSCYDQRTIYLIGTFGPGYRDVYAPETMFEIAEQARKARANAREVRKTKRVNKIIPMRPEYAVNRNSVADTPGACVPRLRISPAPGYGLAADAGSGYSQAI